MGTFRLETLNDTKNNNPKIYFEDEPLSTYKVVEMLNKQENSISELQREKEELKERVNYWGMMNKLMAVYYNSLEKAIEQAFDEKPNEELQELIDEKYNVLEKELEETTFKDYFDSLKKD